MTNPPVSTTPAPSPAPSPAPGTNRSLRIALLSVGSALVAGLLVTGSVQFAAASTGEDESGRYLVEQAFTALDIDVSAAAVTVRYDDVPEAVLDFSAGQKALRFEHEVRGDTLEVRVVNRGWWVFGLISGPFSGLDSPRLDVVLPKSLAPVALDVQSSAGDVDASGTFAATDLETSAGNIDVAGSAESLRLSTSAGNIDGADLEVDGDVSTHTSAGNADLSFETLPAGLRMQGSAGNITAELPAGEYEIDASTSFGTVDRGVPSTPGADRHYSFATDAGDIHLRAR